MNSDNNEPASEIQVYNYKSSIIIKLLISIIIIISIILIVATNPNEINYDTFLKNQAIQTFNGNPIATGLTELFGSSLIDSSTVRTNYVLFSTYKTAINSNQSIVYLGILGHFVPISTNNTASNNPTTSSSNSNNDSIDNSPFVFNETYPQNIAADATTDFSFSIKNNTDVPIVQVSLEFENTSGVKIIPNNDWTLNNGMLSNMSIDKENLLISNSSSLNSSFTFVIEQPGTYQFKIIPKVLAGDWQTIGTYIVSLNVQDSPEAQQLRNNQSQYNQVNSSLNQNATEIEDTNSKIASLETEIVDEKTRIIDSKQSIVDEQDSIAENPSSANQAIQNYSQEIQDSNTKIAQYQAQLDQLKDSLNSLKTERETLESQKINLQSTLTEP